MPYSLSLAPCMTSNTTDVSSSGAIASASSEYSSSYAAWMAFDGSYSSWWRSGAFSGSVWLQYRFPSAKVVRSYVFMMGAASVNRPTNWQFQGSNNGSTWTTLDTQSVGDALAGPCKAIYDTGNTTAYAYYRIYVTAIRSGGTYCSIDAVLFRGPDPTGDCLRICDFAGSAYRDVYGSDTDGFSALSTSKVVNDAGSLEFTLSGSAAYASTVSPVLLVDAFYDGGVGREWQGRYLLDDSELDWLAVARRCMCIGVAGFGARKRLTGILPDGGPADSGTFLDLASECAVGNNFLPLWWSDPGDITTATLGSYYIDGGGNCLSALQDIATQLGLVFWFDTEGFIHVWQEQDLSGYYNAHTLTITETTRDLVNQVIVKGSSTWTINHAASQALYGVFTQVVTDSTVTTSARATAVANAIFATQAYPSREIVASVRHVDTPFVGAYARLFKPQDAAAGSGYVAIGTLRQTSWTLGDLFDEVTVSSQPLSLATALKRRT